MSEKKEKHIFRGWMKQKDDRTNCMLFSRLREELKEGDILTDYKGTEWIVDVIF